MNYELLTGEKRWEILEIIARKPSSPAEIAERIGVSVSYVSQQLKFLEVAGVIESKRTDFFEKGRPRYVFSVKKDIAALGVLNGAVSFKRVLELDKFSSATMNILSLEGKFHYPLQKLFWSLDLDSVDGIYFDGVGKVFIVSGKNLKVEGFGLNVEVVKSEGGWGEFVKIYGGKNEEN